MEVQLWSSKLDLKTAEGKRKPGSTSTSSSTLVMSMPVIQNEHNICPGHVEPPSLPWIAIEGRVWRKGLQARVTYPEANVLAQNF